MVFVAAEEPSIVETLAAAEDTDLECSNTLFDLAEIAGIENVDSAILYKVFGNQLQAVAAVVAEMEPVAVEECYSIGTVGIGMIRPGIGR